MHRIFLLIVSLAAPALAGVRGDYVEARTASVFCGACHYNGERVTEGRSAVMAWNLTGGAFENVDLAGTRVVATVTADDNLAEPAALRTSELVVDADTDAKAAAAVAWVKSQCPTQLGTVGVVRRSKIAFRHDADEYEVTARGVAALSVRPMPDAACCSQPYLVWYQPLMPIDGKRVGYTQSARAGDRWQRSDENSAFYGTFDR